METNAMAALKSLTLLYVEDDTETREELAMMLMPWVGALHVAADGQAGLDLFKATRPDIVITDIQMPRVSGLAMSGEITRLVPDQAIVVISAFNDSEYLFRAIELGIDQYIAKPVNVERMLDKLAKMASKNLATKLKKNNMALLEQYKYVVDQSALVCKLDLSGRITYINEKFCQVSGFTAQELLGNDLSLIRENQDWGAGWDSAVAGTKWTGIVRNRTRSGQAFVVESSLVPKLDADGRVAEIICMEVDITALHGSRDKLAQALEKSKFSVREQRHFLEEYKRALELGTCVCVTDSQFDIISVNLQFELLLGYASKELLGLPITALAPAISRDVLLNQEQNSSAGHIVHFVARSAVEMLFSVSCVPVHRLDGAVESIIMICRDISESLRLSRDIVETQRELLYVMGDVLENRSTETGQHVRRVAVVSRFLALKAGLDTETAEMIETAAPMHDVGKVGIRDAILNKQGKLDPVEYEEMKHHARIGHSILGRVDRPLVRLASTIAQQHHERWDGSGYPFGLAGEEISIAGRIVAIADVLDALSSMRIYKPAWTEQRVYAYFQAQRGLQFDPTLVDILLAHWDTVKSLREGHSMAQHALDNAA